MTQTPQPVPSGRFTCPICPAHPGAPRFESIGDKKRHIREKHTERNTR